MKLRKKTALAIAITFILSMVFGYIYTHTLFLDGYLKLENQEIEANVRRFHYTLNHEINDLGALTSDWAIWDDTYTFIDDLNPDYIQSNLVDSTFSEMGLNFIIYLNSKGEKVYEKAFDLEKDEEIPFSNSTASYIKNLTAKSLTIGEEPAMQGIFSDNGLPVIFASSPILTSQDEGPSRGTLVFGKLIMGDLLEHLNLSLASEVSIIPYTSEKYESIPPSKNQDFRVDAIQEDFVHFYSLIRGSDETPIFIVSQTLPRTIYQQGVNSGREFLSALFITGLLASIIAMSALEFGFLKRFSQLIFGVRAFEAVKQNGSEMILKGRDEIADLSREMHNALSQLAETQNDLKAHLDFEKILVSISTKFIALPIEKIDEGIGRLLKVIGEFSMVDRCYIFMFDQEKPEAMSVTHEWCAPGLPSIRKECQKIPVDFPDLWIKKMQKGETLVLNDISQLQAADTRLFSKFSVLSAAAAPLILNGDLIGFLGYDAVCVQRNWSDQTILLLEMVRVVIINAIDRSRHENQILQNHKFSANLNELTKNSIGNSTLASTCRTISGQLNQLIGSDSSYLVIQDGKSELAVYKSGRKVTLDKAKQKTFQVLTEKSGVELFQSGDIETSGNLGFNGLFGKSFLILPLISEDIKLGSIIFTFKSLHNFSKTEIDFCKQSAIQITLLILKIKAFEAANQKSDELSALRATVADITSELKLDKLLHTLLERSIRLINADGGDFCMVNEETGALQVEASINMEAEYVGTIIPYGTGASGKVFITKKTKIIEDYSVWPGKLAILKDSNLHAAIILPLLIGDRVLGTLGIFHSNPEKKFSPDDLHLLSLFAQHASIAMENALLFDKVQKLARIDDVTGLYNRRAFNEVGEYEISRATRQKHPVSLAMLDLDNFKEVNDLCGHQVGDEVLKEVARMCRESIRNIDVIARYGGDEMIILMPETGPEAAALAMERLRKVFESKPVQVNGRTFSITASIGLASIKQDPPSLSEIIQKADSCLYKAKKDGKNCIRVSILL